MISMMRKKRSLRDLDDEEETKSSEPPKIDGEAPLLPALHAEGSQSLNRDPIASNLFKDGRELTLVSERHKFKSPNSSPKKNEEASGENLPRSGVNARHGSFDSTDDEDDSSSIPAVASSTEKGSKEIIDVSTTVREVIRKGGSSLDNLQWSSQLAKNLAEGERRTKSPPGTPQSHECIGG